MKKIMSLSAYIDALAQNVCAVEVYESLDTAQTFVLLKCFSGFEIGFDPSTRIAQVASPGGNQVIHRVDVYNPDGVSAAHAAHALLLPLYKKGGTSAFPRAKRSVIRFTANGELRVEYESGSTRCVYYDADTIHGVSVWKDGEVTKSCHLLHEWVWGGGPEVEHDQLDLEWMMDRWPRHDRDIGLQALWSMYKLHTWRG